MQNFIPITHYADIYDVEIIDPTCGIRNFILMYDNHEEFDPIRTLVTQPKNKQFHMIILFVQNGECSAEINGKKVTITAGNMLMVYPESVIRFTSASDDIRYFMLVIYPRLLGLTFEDLGNTFNIAKHTQRFETVAVDNDAMNYCLQIYNEMKVDTCRPPYEYKLNYLRSLLNVVMVKIFNIFGMEITVNEALPLMIHASTTCSPSSSMLSTSMATHSDRYSSLLSCSTSRQSTSRSSASLTARRTHHHGLTNMSSQEPTTS